MADHREYLPPTQSQNLNMLSGSIPNSVTAASLVDSATKFLATADSLPALARNHSFADRALVMVS